MTTLQPANCRIEIWRGTKQIDDISQDVVNELFITLPLFQMGISDLALKLENQAGEYTDQILNFDVIKAYLWRQGDSEKKMFEGRVVNLGYEGDLSLNEHFLTLTAEDHGQEFHAPPQLIQKLYESVLGKTIITDILSTLNKCTDTTYVDPDGDIASNQDLEFDEVTPYNAIMDVLKDAQTSGGETGFDAYIDVEGRLHVFKRGKYTSPVTPVILAYGKTEDIHKLRNKITVYGANEKAYPADKDGITEATSNTYGSWAPYGEDAEVSADATNKILGSNSIKLHMTASAYYGRMIFTFTAGKEPCCFWKHDPSNLQFYAIRQKDMCGLLTVQLLDDADQILRRSGNVSRKDEWELIDFPCHRRHENSWTIDPTNTQAFNWKKIKKIDITMHCSGTCKKDFWVDALYFNKFPFSYTANNVTSQSNPPTGYYVRRATPITDTKLKSDAECEKRAKVELRNLSNPVLTFPTLTVEGDHDLVQGDKLPVAITIPNINDNYRMAQIQHELRYTMWKSHITLSNV